MDLFLLMVNSFKSLQPGLLDVCTKYMVIIPIMSKNEANVASGFMEALNKIKGNPQSLYADDEKVLNTDAIQQNLKRHKIW